MKKLSFCLLFSSIFWFIGTILFFTVSEVNDLNGSNKIINSIFLFISIIAAVFWLSIIWRVYKLQYYDTWVLTLSSILGILQFAFFGYYLGISKFNSSYILTLIIIFIGLIGSIGMFIFSIFMLIGQTTQWVTFILKWKRRFILSKKNAIIFPDKIIEKIIFIDISDTFPSKTNSIYKAVFIAAKVSPFKIKSAEYIFAIKKGIIVKIFKFRDNNFRGIEINLSNLNAIRSRYNRLDLSEKDIGSFILNITGNGIPKILNKTYLNKAIEVDKIKGIVSYNF